MSRPGRRPDTAPLGDLPTQSLSEDHDPRKVMVKLSQIESKLSEVEKRVAWLEVLNNVKSRGEDQ